MGARSAKPGPAASVPRRPRGITGTGGRPRDGPSRPGRGRTRLRSLLVPGDRPMPEPCPDGRRPTPTPTPTRRSLLRHGLAAAAAALVYPEIGAVAEEKEGKEKGSI